MRLKCWLLTVVLIAGAVAVRADTTVIVKVTGLVTIADIDGTKYKTLYLLDASDETGHHIVPHIGVILARKTFDMTVQDGRTRHTEGDFYWIRVKGAEQLRVKGGSTTADLTYTDTPPATPPCPQAGEESSLFFFPRLSTVAKRNDGTKLDKNDLDPKHVMHPKKADKTIAAYMDVRFGTLAALTGNPAVWAFKASPKSFGAIQEQVTAETLEWQFDITGDTLTLESIDENNVAKDMVTLKADGGKIRLTLANAPNLPKNIGVKYLAGTETAPATGPVDHHFKLYYNYLLDTTLNLGGKKFVRNVPVVSGVCVEKVIDSQPVIVFTKDPCEIIRYVDIPDPGNCTIAQLIPPPPAVGNLNCGPDGLP